MKFFDDMVLNRLEKGDLDYYKKFVFSVYGLGNLYMRKILRYKNEKLNTYGQVGFAHKYLIDLNDIVSITSGYFPVVESNLEKVDCILNITEKDKEEYIDYTLEELLEKGYEISFDDFDFRKELGFKELKNTMNDYSFFGNFLYRLYESYEDFNSGLYFNNKYWNEESLFWGDFKNRLNFSLEQCEDNKDVVNDLCSNVYNESINRYDIFKLIKNNSDDKFIRNMDIVVNDSSIEIKNLCFEKESKEDNFFIKELLKSDFVSLNKDVDNQSYGLYNVILYKNH